MQTRLDSMTPIISIIARRRGTVLGRSGRLEGAHTMPVEWKDPPPDRAAVSAEGEAIAGELRSRPGEWAIVARDKAPETATRIKNGTLVSFRPAGSFEARTAG